MRMDRFKSAGLSQHQYTGQPPPSPVTSIGASAPQTRHSSASCTLQLLLAFRHLSTQTLLRLAAVSSALVKCLECVDLEWKEPPRSQSQPLQLMPRAREGTFALPKPAVSVQGLRKSVQLLTVVNHQRRLIGGCKAVGRQVSPAHQSHHQSMAQWPTEVQFHLLPCSHQQLQLWHLRLQFRLLPRLLVRVRSRLTAASG